MKLVVGLGNPGSEYQNTRHNAGFMVVDRLCRALAPNESVKGRFNAATVEARVGEQRCLLLKPTTYMNRSGASVAEAVRFFKLQIDADMLVVVDDLYLPVGSIRIKPAGGAGGHNGLTDISRVLGTDNYPRLRVGIGAKPDFMDQADYVLSRFTEAETPEIASGLDRAAKAGESFIRDGLAAAMNKFNGPDKPPQRQAKPGDGGSPTNPPATR
jgi:PTH1 family peptidyl-tRNA hydrolase